MCVIHHLQSALEIYTHSRRREEREKEHKELCVCYQFMKETRFVVCESRYLLASRSNTHTHTRTYTGDFDRGIKDFIVVAFTETEGGGQGEGEVERESR